MRIENLEFKEATYLLPKEEWPEHPSWEIVYWHPNEYYNRKDEFKTDDNYWYQYKNVQEWNVHFRIHKDCFKHPEICYSIATFEYDENESFYELKFVGDRPLSLDSYERAIFWKLIEYGNKKLNGE